MPGTSRLPEEGFIFSATSTNKYEPDGVRVTQKERQGRTDRTETSSEPSRQAGRHIPTKMTEVEDTAARLWIAGKYQPGKGEL